MQLNEVMIILDKLRVLHFKNNNVKMIFSDIKYKEYIKRVTFMTFKEGNYTSKIEEPVNLQANVSIKDNKITDVRLYSESRQIDSELENAYRGQIITNQSVNIDGITSASVLNRAVKSVVGGALADAIID